MAKILGSRDREITREFARLQSYHLFVPHFCLVRRPNEKGHVERLLDYARSNFLVPVPAVYSLTTLNVRLTELITTLREADQDRHLLRLRQQLGKPELLFDVIGTAY